MIPVVAPATIGSLLAVSRLHLREAGLEHPRLEATILAGHVLGLEKAELLAHPDRPVTSGALRSLDRLIARRARSEPLAYILGEREFFGRSFLVDRRALIPRPETELLVETALEVICDLAPRPLIVDVGTGSGCIAATLALEVPAARIVACDLSGEALALAGENLERHGVAERVRLVRGDLLSWVRMPPRSAPRAGQPEPLAGHPERSEGSGGGRTGRWKSRTACPSGQILRCAQDDRQLALDDRQEVGASGPVVVANLPYIPTEALDALPPDVRDHEPRLALDGGPGGGKLILRLISQASALGVAALLAELDPRHAEAVHAAARAAFLGRTVEILLDLAGRPRLLRVGAPE